MVLDMNELGKEQKGNVTVSKVFTIDTVKPWQAPYTITAVTDARNIAHEMISFNRDLIREKKLGLLEWNWFYLSNNS